jgi:peptidoglycan/LPS O-acetylase OafA/YrhL
VLVLAGSLAVWSVHRWFPEARDFGFGGTWFRFFLGVLTFWATQEKLLRAALIGAAIMIGIASATLSDQRGAMAAAAALLILFASTNGRSTRWLTGQKWQHLGRISYSLYLSHVAVGLPLMNWIWRGLPHSPAWAGAMCVVGIAVSLAGAEALHRLVESPALRLSQRIRYAPTGGIAPEPVRRGVIHGSVEGGMVPAEPGG